VLSTFVVLQVIVYAGAQIPAGLLLDRFGSKTLILSGAALMASGQLALAFTESLPTAIAARAVVGLGDAFTFISVGGPGSMVGFDFARTFNPSATLGTASGLVNMGGFIASLLVMQAMGIILDAAGEISFDSLRLAWTVQYAIWALAVVGILITRHKTRRQMRADLDARGERMLLEGLDAHPVGPQLAPARRGATVGLLDCRDQLGLAHRRATRDVQSTRNFH
jgi:MFS family permease